MAEVKIFNRLTVGLAGPAGAHHGQIPERAEVMQADVERLNAAHRQTSTVPGVRLRAGQPFSVFGAKLRAAARRATIHAVRSYTKQPIVSTTLAT